MKKEVFWSVLLALSLLWPVSSGGGEITIGSKADWLKWTFNGRRLGDFGDKGVEGVVEVTPYGRIKLGRVKREINAAVKAPEYGYERWGRKIVGGVKAGSNDGIAKRVIDGKPYTYWMPSMNDPLDSWWISLDLGFGVTAKRIRIVFPEDKRPFPEFRVFVSDGWPKFPGSKTSQALDYIEVARTVRPNDKHIFEIVFDTEENYVASGGTLPREAEDREVVFVREDLLKDRQGNLLLGMALQHVKLVFGKKGEGTGLAEIEVWALQNVVDGILQRGGSAEVYMGDPMDLIDGNLWSHQKITHSTDWERYGWFWIDLGNVFWVTAIRIISLPVWRTPPGLIDEMDGFKLYVSDGTEAAYALGDVWKVKGRPLVWEEVADVKNDDLPQLWNFDILFSPRRVRYIFFHHDYGGGFPGRQVPAGAINQIQVFGEGVIPGVTLRSNLIDLGTSANLSSLSWSPSPPPGTKIEFRTRTGNDVQLITHYYDRSGNEISEEAYNSLPKFFRGDTMTETVPVEALWSPWSGPYKRSGEDFKSPSPRRYLFIEANLYSEDLDVAPFLDSITLSFTKPAADSLIGWISPREVSEPARRREFTFTIVPTYKPGNVGFNQVLIFPTRTDTVHLRIRGVEKKPSRIEFRSDTLFVQLPQVVRRDTVEVTFRDTIFVNGTTFSVLVGNSRVRGLLQRVEPDPKMKNATTVRVPSLSYTEELIKDLVIEPEVITPNGDGINDRLELSFTLLKVDRTRQVTVRIYDLRGDMVAEPFNQQGTTGRVSGILWDGKGAEGHLVSPGLYICEIKVDGDAGKTRVSRTVAVVY